MHAAYRDAAGVDVERTLHDRATCGLDGELFIYGKIGRDGAFELENGTLGGIVKISLGGHLGCLTGIIILGCRLSGCC